MGTKQIIINNDDRRIKSEDTCPQTSPQPSLPVPTDLVLLTCLNYVIYISYYRGPFPSLVQWFVLRLRKFLFKNQDELVEG